MAGQLVQVATNTVTSAVASVTLTGIDSDDVYMVAMNNVLPDTDSASLLARFTVSGTPDTSSNYDRAYKNLRGDSAFSNINYTNNSYVDLGTLGTAGQEMCNSIQYLYNFNNASEYSFWSIEASNRNNSGHLRGFQGGGVLTEAQATDGIQYYTNSGNIASGTFTLYKVV